MAVSGVFGIGASVGAVGVLSVQPCRPCLLLAVQGQFDFDFQGRNVLAAVEFDDTGSTRVGKYVFDHPFLIPGVCTIAFAVALGFVFGGLIL